MTPGYKSAVMTAVLMSAVAGGLGLAERAVVRDEAALVPREIGTRIEISPGYLTGAAPSEVVTFAHTVRNLGGEAATVTVRITAEQETWLLAPARVTVTLDAGAAQDLFVPVAVPATAGAGGAAAFDVTAAAAGDDRPARTTDRVVVLGPRTRIYLPTVSRDGIWAPPALAVIENWNMDGDYVVRWRGVDGGHAYTLQQATDDHFTDATTVQDAPAEAYLATGRATGIYYYRVRAGRGGWSRTQSVIVLRSPAIYGIVSEAGSPGRDVPLALHRLGPGGIDQVVANVTTSRQGLYQFEHLPDLAADSVYVITFGPNTADTGRVYLWQTFLTPAYAAGDSQRGGDFDVANVKILGPDTAATLDPPITFSWQVRAATADDDYMVRVLDLEAGRKAWESGHLGYAGGYTLATRPPELEAGRQYGWQLVIYGTEGVGYSNGQWTFTFRRPAVADVDVNNRTGRNCSFQMGDMETKTIPPGQHAYGSVSPGYHVYHATCWCGSGMWLRYFPAGSKSVVELTCEVRRGEEDGASLGSRRETGGAPAATEPPWR
jgi:hypothetical protein